MANIYCAKCKCTLESRPRPSGQKYFACPSCGTGDTLDNIKREIGEQAAEYAARHLETAFAEGAGTKKLLKAKARRRPKKIYRFVIDLDR